MSAEPPTPPGSSPSVTPAQRAAGQPVECAVLAVISVAILAFPLYPRWLAEQTTALEACAAVSLAWSVWLLAHNYVAGWWVGLVGVVLYAIVFWNYTLFGEVGLQGFYFVMSLQAIVLWHRGGPEHAERPVCRATPQALGLSAVAALLATVGLAIVLSFSPDRAPVWDAVTTVLSVTAHLYLMGRYVESWYLWVAVDTIYVPLYASRGLTLTAILYGVFWILALRGLLRFRRLYAEQHAVRSPQQPAP